MACYHPLHAFQKGDARPVFKVPAGGGYKMLLLGCGRCIGCRLERSRQWAVRCVHEASMHEQNCFITLTYDKRLTSMSLEYRDFQLFMKRLRKSVGPLRFYMCGEYGERYSRPHFHACLFGYDFPDKRFLLTTGSGSKLYTSELLSGLWGLGHCSVGSVNFQSAGYVARYVMKKVLGDGEKMQEIINPDTGEVFYRAKEFSRMSLGGRSGDGGIGKSWLQRFGSDVYPHGSVVSGNVEAMPPRYYDNLYKLEDAIGHEAMLARRRVAADLKFDDNGPARLVVKEKVKAAQVGMLIRSL